MVYNFRKTLFCGTPLFRDILPESCVIQIWEVLCLPHQYASDKKCFWEFFWGNPFLGKKFWENPLNFFWGCLTPSSRECFERLFQNRCGAKYLSPWGLETKFWGIKLSLKLNFGPNCQSCCEPQNVPPPLILIRPQPCEPMGLQFLPFLNGPQPLF